jgi:hypothetical protein
MIPSNHERIALHHFDAQHPAPPCLDIGSGVAPIMNRAIAKTSTFIPQSHTNGSSDNFSVHEIRAGISSIASMTWTMNLKNPLFLSFERWLGQKIDNCENLFGGPKIQSKGQIIVAQEVPSTRTANAEWQITIAEVCRLERRI